MQITEMRSALNAESRKRTGSDLPEAMPDWAVRRSFELRNGLRVTALPRGMVVRSAADIIATSTDATRRARLQRALDEIAAREAADIERLKSRRDNLFN